ncbi:MAG: helix-turn-helix transcriptional regulator, partial [Myxococcaceae bacterium]
LARLPKADDFVLQVRQRVTSALSGGEPTLEAIASQLAITPRTLQRRLKEHGTTYQLLLEELRRELALRYLRDHGLEISEVAFLLGFSEPSAFHRAFRRWTGTTPLSFRRQQ